MSVTKQHWEESGENGNFISDRSFVCANCVSNALLQDLLRDESVETLCSYCDSEMAAPIEFLLDAISDAAFFGYTDPANELPYESREGGYQGEVLESYELIQYLGGWTENDRLQEDVEEAFPGQWCKENYFGLNVTEQLRYGWQDFVREIKHRTRYLFLQESGDAESGGIPPSKMLGEVGVLLSTQLKRVSVDSVLARVRVVVPGKLPISAKELGTPPTNLAVRDNRMSPAGIPMFYAAEDERTAVLETYEPELGPDRVIVVGKWQIQRELILLDLTALPEIPDPFDQEGRHYAQKVRFIHEFVDDLTKPVSRTSSSIEYVPTQVVTEYVRRRMRTEGGKSLDGVRYKSSKLGGGIAVVIFAEQENCVPSESSFSFPEEQILKLESFHVLDPSEIASWWDPPDCEKLLSHK